MFRRLFSFSRVLCYKTCDMFSKIYLAALGLSIAVMAFFTYYAWSWLQSIGQPAAAVAGYEYHSNLAWGTLWITSAILLILGNAVLWTTRSAWAIWLTFIFLGIFVVARFFWLEFAFIEFQMRTQPYGTGTLTGPFLAVLLIVIMAAIVFCDQFIVVRLRARTYPEAEKSAPEAQTDTE